MSEQVKIIDLFAGPGGLGEGFSAFENGCGDQPFKIALSVEKESSAHSTLQLRAFYRQFPKGEAPKEYYSFLAGKLGKRPEERLYKLDYLSNEVRAAAGEALRSELGKDNTKIEPRIRDALGKNPGDWILIGGPPCQAYSVLGRIKNASISSYRAEDDRRNFLYREYLNIIAQFKPAVFVMENVKGLLSSKVNGEAMFSKILHDLRCPAKALDTNVSANDYEIFSFVEPLSDPIDPAAFVIRAEKFGIPQTRHRVILLGIRSDLLKNASPSLLESDPFPVRTRNVLDDLPRLRSGVTKVLDTASNWKEAISDAAGAAISPVRKLGMANVADIMESTIEDMGSEELTRGSLWNVFKTAGLPFNLKLARWYQDPSGWQGACNHETRSHMRQDLARYLFCSAYGMANDFSPRAQEFPAVLAPKHKNWKSGKFNDRFKVQVSNEPARTITSHLSKDGHYFIHYDPSQCRSLTVREAARIQTFPDNYFFVGNRTEQFTQVGNAVPPLLANKIAAIVYALFNNRHLSA